MDAPLLLMLRRKKLMADGKCIEHFCYVSSGQIISKLTRTLEIIPHPYSRKSLFLVIFKIQYAA